MSSLYNKSGSKEEKAAGSGCKEEKAADDDILRQYFDCQEARIIIEDIFSVTKDFKSMDDIFPDEKPFKEFDKMFAEYDCTDFGGEEVESGENCAINNVQKNCEEKVENDKEIVKHQIDNEKPVSEDNSFSLVKEGEEEGNHSACSSDAVNTPANSDSSSKKRKKASKKKSRTPPEDGYSCRFCIKKFKSSQALGGHMNRHRQDRDEESIRKAEEILRTKYSQRRYYDPPIAINMAPANSPCLTQPMRYMVSHMNSQQPQPQYYNNTAMYNTMAAGFVGHQQMPSIEDVKPSRDSMYFAQNNIYNCRNMEKHDNSTNSSAFIKKEPKIETADKFSGYPKQEDLFDVVRRSSMPQGGGHNVGMPAFQYNHMAGLSNNNEEYQKQEECELFSVVSGCLRGSSASSSSHQSSLNNGSEVHPPIDDNHADK